MNDINRYKQFPDGEIEDDLGRWVLYDDHIAAMQQANADFVEAIELAYRNGGRDVGNYDEVWITRTHLDRITWEWKGDSGYALVQRDVLEGLLSRLNELMDGGTS